MEVLEIKTTNKNIYIKAKIGDWFEYEDFVWDKIDALCKKLNIQIYDIEDLISEGNYFQYYNQIIYATDKNNKYIIERNGEQINDLLFEKIFVKEVI